MGEKENEREEFIHAIRKFMEMRTLTKQVLNELIDHIDVYETQGTGKNKTQRLVIYYKFVGYLDIDPTQCHPNYTADIREGDPLEIYTTRDGEVIFKKYSLIGGLEDFAAQFCDTLSRNTDFTAAVTDRDGIVAVAGAGKRELLGKNLSPQLEQIMEQRSIYQYRSGQERY